VGPGTSHHHWWTDSQASKRGGGIDDADSYPDTNQKQPSDGSTKQGDLEITSAF
jgi:hypothetical protein